MGANPTFPSIDTITSTENLRTIDEKVASIPRQRHSLELNSIPLTDDLEACFRDLRCLYTFFNPNGTRRQADTGLCSDMLYLIKRELMSISHGTGNYQIQQDASFAHAALILIELCFRSCTIFAGVVDIFVARLQASLRQVLHHGSDQSIHSAKVKSTFWALCVGGIAATNRPERAWFTTKIVPFIVLLGLEEWSDAENVLEEILWHRGWNLPYREFWAEVSHLTQSLFCQDENKVLTECNPSLQP